MRRAGDSYLAAARHADLTAAEVAGALVQMEQDDAIRTAARAWMLAAFANAQGPAADGDARLRTWLVHKTGVTPGWAVWHVGPVGRVRPHPVVAAALAEGGRALDSIGKVICGYTGHRDAADRDA